MIVTPEREPPGFSPCLPVPFPFEQTMLGTLACSVGSVDRWMWQGRVLLLVLSVVLGLSMMHGTQGLLGTVAEILRELS